jgi:hypothetical protein
MDDAKLVDAMVDAYIARRRKGVAFDDTAATQAYWEYEPRFAPGQAESFAHRGSKGSVEGWKIVLRDRLVKREGVPRPVRPPR